MTWFCRITGLFLLCGCSIGCSKATAYRFVDTLSGAKASAPLPMTAELTLLTALHASTLEADVRHLASPEMEGRGRGSAGNALARNYIVSRLQCAGLLPLFNGAFDQPTFPGNHGDRPYAVNVGAYLPALDAAADWIVLVAHYDHLGVRDGSVYPGADDNASAVAMLLALGDALGRVRPPLRRHVALLFPDAEEPPDIRTKRMGSTWFWRHPPFPLAKLHCALVFDLMGQSASRAARAAGLGDAVFLLGAEASPGLARLISAVPPEPGVEPVSLGLPLIESYPFVPWQRFAQSDYHGLREHGGHPFLFISAGRSPTYHTVMDTADTLDYAKLARLTRWVARILVHTAEAPEDLGWTDMVADPRADARSLLRLYAAVGDGNGFPWLLRRALLADRARLQGLLASWEAGADPTAAEYRELTLMSLRLQAALWHPHGWWFALW